MRFNTQETTGFTIVELLIVVVVIAILAAITIVSYNGISGRANDTVVKNDISNMVQKLQIYYAEKSIYPDTNIESEVSQALQGFKASRTSYMTSGTNVNLVYCTNLPEKNQFAIIGWSKSSSSKGFYATDQLGVREFSGAVATGGTVCATAGIPDNRAWMWMYDVNAASGWRPFV